MLRLVAMSDGDKDVKILVPRHQITVLDRRLGKKRMRFHPGDRAFMAAPLHRLPKDVLPRLRPLSTVVGADPRSFSQREARIRALISF